MQAHRNRPLTIAAGVLVAFAIAWVFLYHECASGGAMGSRYRECTCQGIEKLDYDNTVSDGRLAKELEFTWWMWVISESSLSGWVVADKSMSEIDGIR